MPRLSNLVLLGIYWLIRRKRASMVFKAWLQYRRIYLWDVIINVRLALPGETEPSSAEVRAWQGIARSPAFPCKSGTPMVLSVPGERLFVRDAFLNEHWILEPCLKKTSAVLCARFRRMNHSIPRRTASKDSCVPLTSSSDFASREFAQSAMNSPPSRVINFCSLSRSIGSI
ncbi:hypothetical protein CA85_25260 [Allorhodopirellula solitaria]|uniref:Uncharacterized protein n=1 Tax=Allorhodopirellula solitaria TaxID=2527987 RepID=A0A5C5XV34_9BACT|nr:hypothetical protein CA85_25260 [Allorhodopirellula solitaria]